MISELWPLFGLRLTTPRLELRLPREADFAGLCAAAARGIHDDGVHAVLPSRGRTCRSRPAPRGALQHHWRSWATWQPEDWAPPPARGPRRHPDRLAGDRRPQLRRPPRGLHRLLARTRPPGPRPRHRKCAPRSSTWPSSPSTPAGRSPRPSPTTRVPWPSPANSATATTARKSPTTPAPRPACSNASASPAWTRQAHRRVPVEIHGFDACRTMFGLGDEKPRGLT
ncbi:hypothetical protein ACU686_40570 [Yinghuangia aomiensis]